MSTQEAARDAAVFALQSQPAITVQEWILLTRTQQSPKAVRALLRRLEAANPGLILDSNTQGKRLLISSRFLLENFPQVAARMQLTSEEFRTLEKRTSSLETRVSALEDSPFR